MKKIIIITSQELRHKCFRVFLGNQKGIKVVKTISEEGNINLQKLKENKKSKKNLLKKHLIDRDIAEKDFFKFYLDNTKDQSNNIDRKNGFSSSKNFTKLVKKLKPNLLVVYGSSILKGEILNLYKNKILNLHLGISPYYKGSGTNYFPLVNNEPQYVGATFMFLDKSIDGGKVIHQQQANIYLNDNIHQIGNRLILDMYEVYKKIILNFNKIELKNNLKKKKFKIYKRKDFNLRSLEKLNSNFNNKMIEKYINQKKNIYLIKQDWIK